MEPGEKELRKAFEDVVTNNVKAAIEHGNETRHLVRELEGKVTHLENNVQAQKEVIDELRLALSRVQQVVFAGGSSGPIS